MQATSLGARPEEARISLELLDSMIQALRSDPVDELHLANRYATLLKTHVNAFRKRFLRVGRSKTNSNSTSHGSNTGMMSSYPNVGQDQINQHQAINPGFPSEGLPNFGMSSGVEVYDTDMPL
jgi:hypothetical protein